ncbi:MAG: DNA-deoxyinosine glycosylase [Comamonadaceae bacterium]|nr:MAG: DNA-deoxyinosine glycosylase [Comamonadaceae bacterium]
MVDETKDSRRAKAVPAGGLPAPAQAVLYGLAPVAGAQTAMMILGSFPGGVSLARGQYYAHPQNQFWKILAAVWPQHPQPPAGDYAERCLWLLERRLGLWDVYASCEREGSLDSRIRNARVNDFAALAQQCPGLVAIAHNGGESFRHARHTAALGVPVLRLPSTSPANAAISFERKLAAWHEAFAAHGLTG